MKQADPKFRFKVILAFALVYIFWGSTYLAIKIAVGHGAENPGVPPALMSGARFAFAGPILLLFLLWRGKKVAIGLAEALKLTIIGFLLLTCSNVVLAWAEQYVPTGLAALVISVTPMWFMVLETWVMPGEHRFGGRHVTGFALGIFGIAVLLWPQLYALFRAPERFDKMTLIGCLVLQIASVSWATGSVLSKRWHMSIDPFVATGWQMTFGGLLNIIVGLGIGEHRRAVFDFDSTVAIFYLVVFGSWVGFTAYIWLLRNVPTPKVTTYAYVNPVVAVFLGWLVLHEKITPYILAGSVVVLGSVALVTTAENKLRKPKPEKEGCEVPLECGD